MVVLWDSKLSMTATEIVETTNNKTWKECSVWIIINSLLKKGAIIQALNKPTQTKNARAYQAALTSDDYAALTLRGMIQAGVRIDATTFLKRIFDTEEG